MSTTQVARAQAINLAGHLVIGGCDTVELAERFGTPLYVLDEAAVRERARAWKSTGARIYYAGKALLTTAIARLMAQEGLGLDVVSGGELYTALRAGVRPAEIIMHGNNRSLDELRLAVANRVGLIVVDHRDEIGLLGRLAREQGVEQAVLIRVAPGVEAHTHDYIRTGQTDTKFGIPLSEALEAVRAAVAEPGLRFVGLHSHIGSQILDTEAVAVAAEIMMELAARIEREVGVRVLEWDAGGGLGVRYGDGETPPAPVEWVGRVRHAVADACRRAGIPEPILAFEPGRSIVAEAGMTLYTVGLVKSVPGGRTYLAVDGGMADNPRPALYQARYQALLANRATERADQVYTVVGKFCETGDVLIRDSRMPAARPGDVLAVLATGAYNYSMASNYNRFPRPAMVLVRDGRAELIVRRERYEDLVRFDAVPEHLYNDLDSGG